MHDVPLSHYQVCTSTVCTLQITSMCVERCEYQKAISVRVLTCLFVGFNSSTTGEVWMRTFY